MFLPMRRRLSFVPALSILLLAVPAPAALARRPPPQPTPAQIRAAVAFVQRSRAMWATVNVCNTARHPNSIGIRAQMPSLGFTAALAMDFQVDYYNYAHRRFEPDPGVRKRVELGSESNRLRQGGVMFSFNPPAVLSGTVTFSWRLGAKVVGEATRRTAHGVHGADFGDPPGYSAATCRF
jgi:hypothetical protein